MSNVQNQSGHSVRFNRRVSSDCHPMGRSAQRLEDEGPPRRGGVGILPRRQWK